MKIAVSMFVSALVLMVVLSFVVGGPFIDQAYRFLTVVLAVLVQSDWCAVFILRDVSKRHTEVPVLRLQYERAIIVALSSTLGFLLALYHSLGLYTPPFALGLGLLAVLSAVSIPSLFWLWAYFTDGFDK